MCTGMDTPRANSQTTARHTTSKQLQLESLSWDGAMVQYCWLMATYIHRALRAVVCTCFLVQLQPKYSYGLATSAREARGVWSLR